MKINNCYNCNGKMKLKKYSIDNGIDRFLKHYNYLECSCCKKRSISIINQLGSNIINRFIVHTWNNQRDDYVNSWTFSRKKIEALETV